MSSSSQVQQPPRHEQQEQQLREQLNRDVAEAEITKQREYMRCEICGNYEWCKPIKTKRLVKNTSKVLLFR